MIGMEIIHLVENAKKGNKDAFANLFNMYYTPVYRYIISRSRDENLALDLTQDVFLKWYQSLARYDLPKDPNMTSPLSYLFTIAKRLMINQGLKKSSVHMPENADEFIPSDDLPADYISEIKLTIGQIYTYFDQLTETEREFIELKYMSELDNKEISIIMERSVDALRQIEHRAIKKLRVLYNAKYNTNAKPSS